MLLTWSIFGFILFFSLFTILTQNTIFSVLSLILVFFGSALILLQFGLDYIPLILIIIYVGALSILFLFVIMMLNIKIANTKFNKLNFVIIFISLLSFLIFWDLLQEYYGINTLQNLSNHNIMNFINKENPIISIGYYLFNYLNTYMYLSSLILFIAMLGSVSLVLEPHKLIKSQNIYQQISRKHTNAFFKIK